MKTPSNPPITSLSYPRNQINYKQGDPASPALVIPMIDKTVELEEVTIPAEIEAIEQLRAYCISKIDEGMEFGCIPAMGELEDNIWPFLHGYLRAKTGDCGFH